LYSNISNKYQAQFIYFLKEDGLKMSEGVYLCVHASKF